MRDKGKVVATVAAGAFAAGFITWTLSDDLVQVEPLSDDGVRGSMVTVFGRTFVFYTAKNRPRKR